MSGTLWFKHDMDARYDRKHIMMRQQFGAAGYGVYWIIIESLANEEDYELPYNKDTFEIIATDAYLNVEEVETMVDYFIEKRLLEKDGEFFWSDSLRERLSALEEIRQKRVESGKLGAEIRWRKPEQEKKKTAIKFPEDTTETLIAKWYAEEVKSLSPKNKKLPKNRFQLDAWAYEFDKMMRIDKREMEEIKKVAVYALKDKFWQGVVLSPDALRKHFDKIELQIKNKRKPEEDNKKLSYMQPLN